MHGEDPGRHPRTWSLIKYPFLYYLPHKTTSLFKGNNLENCYKPLKNNLVKHQEWNTERSDRSKVTLLTSGRGRRRYYQFCFLIPMQCSAFSSNEACLCQSHLIWQTDQEGLPIKLIQMNVGFGDSLIPINSPETSVNTFVLCCRNSYKLKWLPTCYLYCAQSPQMCVRPSKSTSGHNLECIISYTTLTLVTLSNVNLGKTALEWLSKAVLLENLKQSDQLLDQLFFFFWRFLWQPQAKKNLHLIFFFFFAVFQANTLWISSDFLLSSVVFMRQ